MKGVYRLGKHALVYVGVNVLFWVRIVRCVSVTSAPHLSENTFNISLYHLPGTGCISISVSAVLLR